MKFQSLLVRILCCFYFIVAGFLLIPYPGFQHDEVVFAEPVFQRGLAFYCRPLGARFIPMMINSYAGAFKTWVYWPILKVWHPSAYSLRVPVLLIAALSILLFWPIMVRAGGRRAATIATILLATDTMYLMTSVFDWGPVALQHILLVAVMYGFIRFDETRHPAWLALASFLCGLALWEKALFFWIGGALAVACVAVWFKRVWAHANLRNIALAAVCLAIGASPFILYNIHKPNSTLSENTNISTEELSQKIEAAKRTVDAHAIFDYIVFDDWMKPSRTPQNAIESASLALRDATGTSQINEMLWAYALAIVLAPFAWRTAAWRPLLFALIFAAAGWALMLITKNAGGSVHHVILLWPMPLMFLALAWSEASKRIPRKIAVPALGVVVAFFAAENVLATNQYLAQFIRNGPTVIWTNALYPLSADLTQHHYGEIDGIDWGTIVPLRVLERATVPLEAVNVDPNAPQSALAKMNRQDAVFLGHVKGLEVFEGVNDKLDAIAAKQGFVKQTIKTFADENGRPVFELFQYHVR
jgi:hypothetical protein